MTSIPYPEVNLVIGGKSITGWTYFRGMRSVESVPNSFELGMTELYPGDAKRLSVTPGAPCKIVIGGRPYITGYVDRVRPAFSAQDHGIRVVGRGICQDLVDCSVTASIVPGLRVNGGTALGIAQALSKPFGITVVQPSGSSPSVPALQVNLGETPFDVIERIARWSRLLAYENEQGQLVLSAIGTGKAVGALVEGVNVDEATAEFGMDERFSVYYPALMSVDKTNDIGGSGNSFPPVYDKGVTRYRPRVIVSEQFQNDQSIAVARANWECARRYGRSQKVQVMTTSWLDASGAILVPNTLCQISTPSLKIVGATWIIGSVTLGRDAKAGTFAQVELMPPAAFDPEPEILLPFAWQVADDLNGAPPPSPDTQ